MFHLNTRNQLGWQPRSVKYSMIGHGYNTSIPSSVSTSLARVVCIFIIPTLLYATLQEGTLETNLKKKAGSNKWVRNLIYSDIQIFITNGSILKPCHL